MDDLVAFLRARLDEDEAVALDATPGPWTTEWHRQQYTISGSPPAGNLVAEWLYAIATVEPEASIERAECDTRDAEHIARHDPDRVLAEITAKRGIVDRYVWLCEHGDTGGAAWVLPLLALPYAEHPDYRPEWSPDA